ncbi:MAG: GNAT family N-acetyltransferase [bacterium]
MHLRVARPDDLAAVDRLLGRSYPRLLRPDYPPSIMVTLVPIIARARPELLASGRYFVIEAEGRILAAGGYSPAGQWLRPGVAGEGAGRIAEIRHVATDPDLTRQGLGRRLMQGIFAAAEAEGVRHYTCLASRTAVPFYAALGFIVLGPVQVPITRAIAFPAVRMQRSA